MERRRDCQLRLDGRSAIELVRVARMPWPLFGRTTTLNAATYCASVSSISAGQQRNERVAGARDIVCGSEAQRTHRTTVMHVQDGRS
jgi:hypothetical protein